MSYSWNDLIGSIKPFAEKPVGSIRIDTGDIRLIMEQVEEAAATLKPFADLADWIAENRPDRYNPADEVQGRRLALHPQRRRFTAGAIPS